MIKPTIYIFVIITWCISSNGIAQLNERDSLGLKQGFWSLNSTGDTLVSGNYVNDTLHGTVSSLYAPKESLLYLANYTKGKLDGMACAYYMDGSIKKMTQYQMGEKVFEATFRENGTMIEELRYLNGVLHGQIREYFDNGNLRKRMSYNNGKAEGFEITYKRNGKVRLVIEYKNDVVINTY